MDQEVKKPANSIKAFFVRTKSNEGVQIDAPEPLPPGSKITVRGMDSDAVQEAVTAYFRAHAEDKDEEGKPAVKRPFEDLGVICAMVGGWSFDDEATPELVAQTLTEIPSLKIAVVNAALERANFLPAVASDSSSTPSTNSD